MVSTSPGGKHSGWWCRYRIDEGYRMEEVSRRGVVLERWWLGYLLPSAMIVYVVWFPSSILTYLLQVFMVPPSLLLSS